MLLGSITTQKEPQQSIEITGVFYQLGCGRVEMWRGGFRFEHICSRLFRLAVPHWSDHGSVSTSRSSNRTCRSPASGSRTRPHAFVHGTSCPSLFKRTSPKCPYRCESG